MYYKKFNYSFDQSKLLELFYAEFEKGNTTTSGPFVHADHKSLLTTNSPLFEILEKDPNINEFGLSKLIAATGFHTNPGNNGLVVLPLKGIIRVDFYSYSPNPGRPRLLPKNVNDSIKDKILESYVDTVDIDQPTAIRGDVIHNYYPVTDEVIFYAVKIPLTRYWKQIVDKL